VRKFIMSSVIDRSFESGWTQQPDPTGNIDDRPPSYTTRWDTTIIPLYFIGRETLSLTEASKTQAVEPQNLSSGSLVVARHAPIPARKRVRRMSAVYQEVRRDAPAMLLVTPHPGTDAAGPTRTKYDTAQEAFAAALAARSDSLASIQVWVEGAEMLDLSKVEEIYAYWLANPSA
jgi:hypothetical protein